MHTKTEYRFSVTSQRGQPLDDQIKPLLEANELSTPDNPTTAYKEAFLNCPYCQSTYDPAKIVPVAGIRSCPACKKNWDSQNRDVDPNNYTPFLPKTRPPYAAVNEFDPAQARDESGKWTAAGLKRMSDDAFGKTMSAIGQKQFRAASKAHYAAASAHLDAADERLKANDMDGAHFYMQKAGLHLKAAKQDKEAASHFGRIGSAERAEDKIGGPAVEERVQRSAQILKQNLAANINTNHDAQGRFSDRIGEVGRVGVRSVPVNNAYGESHAKHGLYGDKRWRFINNTGSSHMPNEVLWDDQPEPADIWKVEDHLSKYGHGGSAIKHANMFTDATYKANENPNHDEQGRFAFAEGGQINTPEFKKWFGNWQDPKAFSSRRDPATEPVSVAVGDDGKPLRLYHATDKNFDKFEIGKEGVTSFGILGTYPTKRYAIFTTPDVAFAHDYIDGKKDASVMPFFMNMKSPMDLRHGTDSVTEDLEKHGIDPSWVRNIQHHWELFDGEDGKNFVEAAKKEGYDGAAQ